MPKLPQSPRPLSDSDRMQLDELLAERDFAKRTAAAEEIKAEKRKVRLERMRAWVLFGSALLVLKGALWDHIKSGWDFVMAHLK